MKFLGTPSGLIDGTTTFKLEIITMSTLTEFKPVLIETCMEGGSLDDTDVRASLKGKSGMPEVRAFVSMIEHAIGNARNGAEDLRGTERDEFCGAARELRALRTRLNAFLSGG